MKFGLEMALADGITFVVFRLDDGRVAVGLNLTPEFPNALDQHRPPVIFTDSGPIDFGASKEYQAIVDGLDQKEIHYTWEDRNTSCIIWHGKMGEGLKGDLLKLLDTLSLSIRVYFSDYTEASYPWQHDEITELQERLRSRLGLPPQTAG